MAINHVRTTLSPEAVFDHLLDPWRYPEWLLGASTMRDVDASWPEPGSAFHHVVGFGPLQVPDRSKVLEIERPHRLVLHVRVTPIVQGIVTFTVDRIEGGSLLFLQEEPAKSIGGLFRPVLDPATHLRNHRSLQRLAALMERDAKKR